MGEFEVEDAKPGSDSGFHDGNLSGGGLEGNSPRLRVETNPIHRGKIRLLTVIRSQYFRHVESGHPVFQRALRRNHGVGRGGNELVRVRSAGRPVQRKRH